MLNESIGSLVGSLLRLGCPLAIVWAISPVIVNAIKAHAFRSVAHVGVEIFKAVHPSLADLDSSCPVILEVDVIWVMASLTH